MLFQRFFLSRLRNVPKNLRTKGRKKKERKGSEDRKKARKKKRKIE